MFSSHSALHALHCTALYCTELDFSALHFTSLQSTALLCQVRCCPHTGMGTYFVWGQKESVIIAVHCNVHFILHCALFSVLSIVQCIVHFILKCPMFTVLCIVVNCNTVQCGQTLSCISQHCRVSWTYQQCTNAKSRGNCHKGVN